MSGGEFDGTSARHLKQGGAVSQGGGQPLIPPLLEQDKSIGFITQLLDGKVICIGWKII